MRPIFPRLGKWHNTTALPRHSFCCGYCGDDVCSDNGLPIIENTYPPVPHAVGGIYLCPNCDLPTYIIYSREQFPKAKPGSAVSHVPDNLNSLYEEARECAGQGCYTAAVLLCRRLLMVAAVDRGSQEGKKFIEYVDYLSGSGLVPPNSKKWIDQIRQKGNEGAHKTPMLTEEDAYRIIKFSESLLRFLYELPAEIDEHY